MLLFNNACVHVRNGQYVGAGDGRVLLRSVQRGCSYAEGWELNKSVYEVAKMHIDRVLTLNQEENSNNMSTSNTNSMPKCNIIFGDAVDSDPSKFDIVTLFLLPDGLKNIQNWLDEQVFQFENLANDSSTKNQCIYENEIDEYKYKYLKIVTQSWAVPGWKHLKRFVSPTGGTQIYFYVFRRRRQ